MSIITIDKKKLKIGKISIILLTIYILLTVVFYFLAGDQLKYRSSRYNVDMPAAEAAAIELTEESIVEQHFATSIDRIREISVQWGTYYRENSGTITVDLIDENDNTILASQTYNASEIEDGGVTTLIIDPMLEGYVAKELVLRLQSDSKPGKAAAPMMNNSESGDGSILLVNGIKTSGRLCMSVTGEEYIWTGLHYWTMVLLVGLALSIMLIISYVRWHNGRNSLVAGLVSAVIRYKFLIKQLVARDFKLKYKRSVLGVFWSFLNPLLTMAVQYVVFSTLFRFDIEYYPVYLLAGIVMFNYFSESCGLTLGSIVGNAPLITKVYVPKYIYPLTRVMSSLINLVISMIPLLLVALIAGIRPTKAYLLAVFPLICIAVFCLGLGMLLATSMVFFRDTQFLWGVLSMIWMYATPIFYPASILPENVSWILKINPLYYFVDFLRTCIISGISPEPRMYMACILWAVGMLAVGSLIFKKNQDKFVLWL